MVPAVSVHSARASTVAVDNRRRVLTVLRGVRTRVLVGYVTLMSSALFVSTVGTYRVLLAQTRAEIDRELVQEVNELRQLVGGIDPATGRTFSTDVRAIFDTFLARNVPSEGEAFYTLVGSTPYLRSSEAPGELLVVDGLVESWVGLEAPLLSTVGTGVGDARSLVVPIRHEGTLLGVFVVAIFTDGALGEVRRAAQTVGLVGLAVLVATSILAWSMAGRVVRPVRELTTTARRIGERDLTARIPVVGGDELAELGRTFNEMLDRLQAGFTTQRQVLDDVAHELRTPITIVRGHMEMLEFDADSVDETRALVLDEMDGMARYVGDLLTVANAEQPDFLRTIPTDLRSLSISLGTRLRALADREWVAEQIPEAFEPMVLVDERRLAQAMVALATNAVQHTSPGDRIGIGVACIDDHLAMWVRDSGPGLDTSDCDRLFSRFTRGTGSRQHRPDGTGLGLSIVAAIARAHGGSVAVESEPGRGACFTIRLPRRLALPMPLGVANPPPIGGGRR